MDAVGALPLFKGAPAAVAELKALPEVGTVLVNATDDSFKAFKASYSALGVSDDVALSIGQDSERALARARVEIGMMDKNLSTGIPALNDVELRAPGFTEKVFKDARPDQIYNFSNALAADQAFVSNYLDPAFASYASAQGLGEYEKAHMALFHDGV